MAGNEFPFMKEALSVVVIGASGDLAKKKTYPSLFSLYTSGFLSDSNIICGYARSKMTDDEFRDKMRPFLIKHGTDEQVESFLRLCTYSAGGYDDAKAMSVAAAKLETHEAQQTSSKANRVYYFAIPPNVFTDVAAIIKEVGMSTTGWTRVIVEKPFGKDSESFEQLDRSMSAIFTEDIVYRIDHYLGKEMTQNLSSLRFANTFLEPIWNRNHISSVMITFKEDFGTQGRGGYFDQYGIIRDVMQNHLIQVLTLFAMEPPTKFVGAGSEISEHVRDEKVKVLRAFDPVRLDEVVLGQYLGNEEEPGYKEDKTVPDDSVTPTYAAVVFRINNPRWDGVPFIMRAGKALNERKTEIRIQFKRPPASTFMFETDVPANELVVRVQPGEAIYMKTNVKEPGLSNDIVTTELDLSYKKRFQDTYSQLPDAYTRLILDTLRGDKSSFVRDDELRESWKVFTPLLKSIEEKKIELIPYEYGSRGPAQADELIMRVGFKYTGTYKWHD
mmetsp:Transcript_40085/g.159431  ORF Transcript_40085/g.159431 Transcript_40085/m.159431 type:complete len:500 (-) Transcript_40085:791-2290(-)|eukprot:CAMPEP_0113971264 /NCGR_PEP_ID=MMETSP0011_2-20120614/12119_1 /TAXON_ID=101924 /ORGANISM="Rhodosorus marinus" /LENGTH=499 /DNA_ID=CAMNT_0000986699 /DNA_START=144 /DNA_END=1643 /DNA_ORIENTATION=+ /assembly_acc=CAM_ASM_000156